MDAPQSAEEARLAELLAGSDEDELDAPLPAQPAPPPAPPADDDEDELDAPAPPPAAEDAPADDDPPPAPPAADDEDELDAPAPPAAAAPAEAAPPRAAADDALEPLVVPEELRYEPGSSPRGDGTGPLVAPYAPPGGAAAPLVVPAELRYDGEDLGLGAAGGDALYVAVVGFDHSRGNVLEWAHPAADEPWVDALPFLALPDGAHHVGDAGDACRFTAPGASGRLYGASYVMQRDPDQLKAGSASAARATRSKVQKALVVLSGDAGVAWSRRLRAQLGALAGALFASGDLEDRSLLVELHGQLAARRATEDADVSGLFAACAALGFAGALKCYKAALLGQAVIFVHGKSVSAAPDAALALADALGVLANPEEIENPFGAADDGSCDAFGGCLKPHVHVEPTATMVDVERLCALGEAKQLILGTANAHLAEATLAPRLSPCVVARLDGAPGAPPLKVFGPSKRASQAVDALTPSEVAACADLAARGAEDDDFRDDDGLARAGLRSRGAGLLDALAACRVVDPERSESDVATVDRDDASELARDHGGPFVVALLDTAAGIHFLRPRNTPLADWLAAADARLVEEAFNPSLVAQVFLAKDRLAAAAAEVTAEDARAELRRKYEWTKGFLGSAAEAGGELAGDYAARAKAAYYDGGRREPVLGEEDLGDGAPPAAARSRSPPAWLVGKPRKRPSDAPPPETADAAPPPPPPRPTWRDRLATAAASARESAADLAASDRVAALSGSLSQGVDDLASRLRRARANSGGDDTARAPPAVPRSPSTEL